MRGAEGPERVELLGSAVVMRTTGIGAQLPVRQPPRSGSSC